MSTTKFIVTQIASVPNIIGGFLQIGRAFLHRVFVIAVETGFVNQIDNCFFGIRDGEGRICGMNDTIGFHLEYGAEVDGFQWITCGVSRHRQLVVVAFYLMRHLCRHHNLAVDVTLQSDSDELVRVRSKILSCEGFAIAYETIIDEGTVKV